MFGKKKITKADIEEFLFSNLSLSARMTGVISNWYGGSQFEEIIVEKKTPLQEFTEAVWKDTKKKLDRYADYDCMDELAMPYSIYADDATLVARDRPPLPQFTDAVWYDEP